MSRSDSDETAVSAQVFSVFRSISARIWRKSWRVSHSKKAWIRPKQASPETSWGIDWKICESGLVKSVRKERLANILEASRVRRANAKVSGGLISSGI